MSWLFPTDWERFQRRWKKRYGGYLMLPDQPMSKEQAREYLTERLPCGCVTNWWASPPSGWSCDTHMVGCHGSLPDYFVYANEVLHS